MRCISFCWHLYSAFVLVVFRVCSEPFMSSFWIIIGCWLILCGSTCLLASFLEATPQLIYRRIMTHIWPSERKHFRNMRCMSYTEFYCFCFSCTFYFKNLLSFIYSLIILISFQFSGAGEVACSIFQASGPNQMKNFETVSFSL